MNRKSSFGGGMFLLEMIVAVFFFILCSSVCMLIFVKADGLSRFAKDQNGGVLAAESMAEVWKLKGSMGLSAGFYGQPDGDRITVCWDRQWNAVAEQASAAFMGEMSWVEEDGLETADIVISRMDAGKTELFSMTAARYQAEQR